MKDELRKRKTGGETRLEKAKKDANNECKIVYMQEEKVNEETRVGDRENMTGGESKEKRDERKITKWGTNWERESKGKRVGRAELGNERERKKKVSEKRGKKERWEQSKKNKGE